MTVFAHNLYCPTADHCGQVCSTLLYSGVLSSNLSLETKVVWFSQSLQAYATITPHPSLQPLLSTLMSVHYSLMIHLVLSILIFQQHYQRACVCQVDFCSCFCYHIYRFDSYSGYIKSVRIANICEPFVLHHKEMTCSESTKSVSVMIVILYPQLILVSQK